MSAVSTADHNQVGSSMELEVHVTDFDQYWDDSPEQYALNSKWNGTFNNNSLIFHAKSLSLPPIEVSPDHDFIKFEVMLEQEEWQYSRSL